VQDALAPLLVPHTAVGTDVVANQIVVTITAAAGKPAQLLAAAAKYGQAVRVEYTAGAFSTTISGGHPIDYAGQEIGCSLGFNVTGGLALTAGHCTGINGQWENGNNDRYFGPSVGVNFPGDDFGLIRNDGNLSQTGDIHNYSTGARQDIDGAAQNYVGQFVCKSGRTTGTTCATIDALNVTVNYRQGTVFGLVQGEFCTRAGDSGGAVFHGPTAKGLISGGTEGTCRTFYQPVVEALQVYGVSVF
jgi:streptogrisin D